MENNGGVCPHCGAAVKFASDGTAECEYCGASFPAQNKEKNLFRPGIVLSVTAEKDTGQKKKKKSRYDKRRRLKKIFAVYLISIWIFIISAMIYIITVFRWPP